MNVVVMLSKDTFVGGAKTGEPSRFAEKVATGEKRHTVRSNPDYWATKIERLKQQGGTLSLRQWTGKPYRSTQEEIKAVPADVVGVQLLKLTTYGFGFKAEIDGREIDYKEVARNDGLDPVQFAKWFASEFKKTAQKTLTFAVIQFTEFRY